MPWSRRISTAERSSDAAAAREKALELLSGRDFACQELYQRLCRRFTDEAAARVVAGMLQLHYLDDERYATQKARALLYQHRSRRAIADKLREKGVDKTLIEETLEQLFAVPEDGIDPETEAAAMLVQRQYCRRLSEGREDLVLAALARRGFSYRTARTAIALAQAEENDRT